jgi:hypothetical protein
MANREQILPLSACGRDVLARFQCEFKDTRPEVTCARSVATPQGTFIAIAVQVSIRLSTQTCVPGSGYSVLRGLSKSFSGRDISSCMPFVPIRDDPEMVVNLGLPVAEAGLRQLGVAA